MMHLRALSVPCHRVEKELLRTLVVSEGPGGTIRMAWSLLHASGIVPGTTPTPPAEKLFPGVPLANRVGALAVASGGVATNAPDPLRVTNERFALRLQPQVGGWLREIASPLETAVGTDACLLRYAVVAADAPDAQGWVNATVEATVVRWTEGAPFSDALSSTELFDPRPKAMSLDPFAVVQIVPTGVRCEYGGYAGDAGPATNLLAAVSDIVVTHPNAVNASELNEMSSNVLYVEGKSIDDFMLGHVGLLPTRSNSIGTWVDPTGRSELDHLVNALSSARAVAGIDCSKYGVLPEELGVSIEWSDSGCASGTILWPSVLLHSTAALLASGANAIGGVSVIAGVSEEMVQAHLKGEIPNPSGGVEAVISHLISKVFRVPTAHAPLPYYRGMRAEQQTTTNPRAAAEFISTPHYFCVAKGLARAPRLLPLGPGALEVAQPHGVLTLNNVAAVVCPASCLGGVPMLAAQLSGIPIIGVRDNETILTMHNTVMGMSNAMEVSSYMEAAGVVAALREGISLESLRRPLMPPRS